ncbi:MAG: alpha-L-fucosidase, partial [Chlorobia bacterium]|nr:alpha-L-fucosidase [Fimbriimonadaceae bacterium]
MLLTAIAAIAMSPQAPAPKIAVPSKRQLEWQKLEYYAFIHFGPNTFTDEEWGHGKEDPNVFNPTQMDARQWVKTFKDAGMKQVIITAKHHDGFCLWPTTQSKHTVAQSKWRDGKGDVLADLRKACNEYGLKMGVYLSPWDRNHPKYGTPEYNDVFVAMLEEVLTKYGPIYEVWFDGANGEGPNGKRQVYDWPRFIATVRKHAPDAVIFSDAGPDIRWVGNEAGIAGETCWSTIDKDNPRAAIGAADTKYLNAGDPNGKDWVPAECDVSIRPGWFYHANQDDKVKTPEQLMDLWEKSVGRNGALLLNVPPDRRGLIHENDVKSLLEFKKLREETYTVRIPQLPNLIDRITLREDLSKGQSIRKFHVEALHDGEWKRVAEGTTVGHKKIVKIAPIVADDVRVVAD